MLCDDLGCSAVCFWKTVWATWLLDNCSVTLAVSDFSPAGGNSCQFFVIFMSVAWYLMFFLKLRLLSHRSSLLFQKEKNSTPVPCRVVVPPSTPNQKFLWRPEKTKGQTKELATNFFKFALWFFRLFKCLHCSLLEVLISHLCEGLLTCLGSVQAQKSAQRSESKPW